MRDAFSLLCYVFVFVGVWMYLAGHNVSLQGLNIQDLILAGWIVFAAIWAILVTMFLVGTDAQK